MLGYAAQSTSKACSLGAGSALLKKVLRSAEGRDSEFAIALGMRRSCAAGESKSCYDAGMDAATPEQLDHMGALAAGLVANGQRVGLGSGKASLAFVRALGRRVRQEKLRIVGVPTSLQTQQVARRRGFHWPRSMT